MSTIFQNVREEPPTFSPAKKIWLHLEQKVQQDLPRLNATAEASEDGVRNYLDYVRSVLPPLISETKNELGADRVSKLVARGIIGELGWMVSSGERHFQGRRELPGAFIATIDGLDLALAKLGQVANHLPRDSVMSAFNWSRNTFTGEPDEVWNASVVRETDLKLGMAADAVRPIRNGTLRCDNPLAAKCLDTAADYVGELLPLYRGYMQPGSDGRVRMGPTFFLRWRQYLAPYPVAGRIWLGPNPAHIVGWPRLDAAIGAYDDSFVPIVLDRVALMSPEDRPGLEAEFSLSSLTEIFVDICGLDFVGICGPDLVPPSASDREAFATFIVDSLDEPSRAALRAFGRLIKNAGQLTAVHWSLIQNYIVKPSRTKNENTEHNMTLSNDAGVSGRSLDDTKKLMQMRREHPVTSLFAEIASYA